MEKRAVIQKGLTPPNNQEDPNPTLTETMKVSKAAEAVSSNLLNHPMIDLAKTVANIKKSRG